MKSIFVSTLIFLIQVMAEALQLQADMNEFKENFIQEVDQAKERAPLVIRPRKVKVDLDLEFSANNSSNLPSPLTPLRLQPCGKLVLLGPGKAEPPRTAEEHNLCQVETDVLMGEKDLSEKSQESSPTTKKPEELSLMEDSEIVEESKPKETNAIMDGTAAESGMVSSKPDNMQKPLHAAVANLSSAEDAADLSQSDLSALESRNDIDDILLGDGSLSFDVSDMVMDAGDSNTDTEGNEDEFDADEESLDATVAAPGFGLGSADEVAQSKPEPIVDRQSSVAD